LSVIKKSGITEQVTDAIRKAIITGQYKPGQKLSEALLSKHYNVSRTPIREAFKQLSTENLVEIIPRVGTRVSNPTEEELTELFIVKETLEGLAAKLLTERQDQATIDKLEKAVQSMEKAYNTTNYDEFVQANNEFHKYISLGANNKTLSNYLQKLVNQVAYNSFVNLSIKQPNRFKKSLCEHHKILKAIKDANPDLAEQYMKEHVNASAQELKKGIAKQLYT